MAKMSEFREAQAEDLRDTLRSDQELPDPTAFDTPVRFVRANVRPRGHRLTSREE